MRTAVDMTCGRTECVQQQTKRVARAEVQQEGVRLRALPGRALRAVRRGRVRAAGGGVGRPVCAVQPSTDACK